MPNKDTWLLKPEPKMKKVGFWYSTYEPDLPMPVARPRPNPRQEQDIANLRAAEKWAEQIQYRGFSTCRLCGRANGSSEFSAGGYTWPSGYIHYLENHNVVIDAGLAFMLDLNSRQRRTKSRRGK